MIEKRFIQRFCENCGGDKPWARVEWLIVEGFSYCSRYCHENHQAFLAKLARQGRLKTKKTV